MHYIIGIIDEEADQIANIRAAIKTHIDKQDIDVSFKVYPLNGDANTLTKTIAEEIIHDIVEGSIHSLIIDYKLVIHATTVEGTDIYERICNRVPKFPVVILTNRPKDCMNKIFVDADKVYAKSEFFKIDETPSKEKTNSIITNMMHYGTQRAELAVKRAELLELLHREREAFSLDTYRELLHIENRMDELSPQGQSRIEKDLNNSMESLKRVIELLDKADTMYGDNNETI